MFSKRMLTIAVVIAAVLSFGYGAIVLFISDCETWNYERKGTSVEAVVVDAPLKGYRRRSSLFEISGKTYDIEVAYTVDGVNYIKEVKGVKGYRRDGEKVTVIYFDNNPDGEVVVKPKHQFVWVLFVAFLAFFLYAAFRKKPLFNSEIAEELLIGEERESFEERDGRFLDAMQARYKK